jgi:Tol biopolymer transport system component
MAEPDRLDSWKQIAAYLGKSERTVRRWQQTEGLPVHRHLHQQRGSVWAYGKELDEWLERRSLNPEPLPDTGESRGRFGRWRFRAPAAVALVSLTLVVTAIVWSKRRSSNTSIPEPEPLTALRGAAYAPTFSPDGRQVAFYWSSDTHPKSGIYVKSIGSENIRPLVVAQSRGERNFLYSPAWSPDGRTIAFLQRESPQKDFAMYATAAETWLCLIAANGGSVQRVTRLAAGVLFYANSAHLSWSSDSQWIVAPMADDTRRGIYRISISTGEARRITTAAVKEFAPALSPDGRVLIFMRQEGPAAASIEQVVRQKLTADWKPEGAPLVLFEGRSMSSGLAWTPSGKELIFCSADSAFYGPFNSRLYRMRADTRSPLVPIGLNDCSTVAISRPDSSGRVMMIYATGENTKSRLWQADLSRLDRPALLAPSSRFDGLPSHSPDGSLIAFLSNRSGKPEIWIMKRQGGDIKRITENSHVSSIPRWSPDGSRLVYGGAPPGRTGGRAAVYGLYTAAVVGGVPSRVPLGQQSASDPGWSPDGRWIYYWSDQQLWRTHPDGSGSARMGEYSAHFVRQGIFEGENVYYTRASKPFAVCRTAIGTGKEEVLAEELATPFFAVTRKFVYFLKHPDFALHQMPLAGGPARPLGVIPQPEGIRPIVLGISVSPDDSSIVWAITNTQQLDLQLVRDFR